MRQGEKLFKFLANLMLEQFYGTVTIRFESGKVTHVATKVKHIYEYRDRPDEIGDCDGSSNRKM